MKKLLSVLLCSLVLAAGVADAKGGGSGGGGHGGGGGSRGGFSSSTGRSAAAGPSAPARSTTTTTTTTSRSYSSSYSYGGRYVSPGPMYGGWGMGYGYSNGLLTGMIIGNMMHPYNTVMYMGPGSYYNNALLYPDGRVVNQQGYVVGTYMNGQFNPMNNGPMVGQAVPADAGQQVAQPIIVKAGPSVGDVIAGVFLIFACVILFLVIIGMLLS